MEMQLEFLKRHGFVIAGLGLPLLVVLAFVLARTLPRYLVEAPRYELVYSSATNAYSGTPRNVACVISAVDGRVRVRWTPSKDPVYAPDLRAFRFDPATGDVQELDSPEPSFVEGGMESRDVFPTGLEDVRIDTSLRAPDGYEFEAYYGGSRGLFGELFSSGSRGQRSRVIKEGRSVEVPHASQDAYGYGSMNFIGWAIPIEDGR